MNLVRTFFTMLVLEKNKRRYIKFSFCLQTNFHCIDSKQNESINWSIKTNYASKDESATIIDVSFPKDDITLSLSPSLSILLSVVDHEWVGKPKGPPFE